MKPLLLHGPAKAASRKKLIELKQKFDQNDVVVYEEGTNLQTILGGLSTQSLFSEDRLIVLENPPEGFVFDLPLATCNLQLIIWFDHEIEVKKWPGFEILLFPESKEVSVFPFLDCLALSDKKAFLEADKLKKAGFDIFYFLTMTYYLLRNLAATPQRAPVFVKDKLQRQRKNFPKEKITKLYKDTLELEFKLKSGLVEKDQAEFLLINKFISD